MANSIQPTSAAAGQLSQSPSTASAASLEAPSLDDLDADDLLIQAMSDRQKLTELGKLVGMVRYAVEGHDTPLLQDTKRKMQRITTNLAEKYRGSDLVTSAVDPRRTWRTTGGTLSEPRL